MGTLYIIATPIGNLGDITLRALEVLKSVDLVACEDTRQTVKLLNHYNIAKPLVSYFQHSKLSKIGYIAGELAAGKNIALVTDAGTPGISDPGGKIIEHVTCNMKQGASIKIIPIPGPSAVIAALSISGFPADKFIFMGFPPHKKGRNKFFEEVAAAEQTMVFYESTHRILKTLGQLASSLRGALSRSSGLTRSNPPVNLFLVKGNLSSDPPIMKGEKERGLRQIVVCRELTKMFESIYRGTAEEILNILNSDKDNQKGEFVIVVKKYE